MKIQDAVYQCDFCEEKSSDEYSYIFKYAWDDSSHATFIRIGLCKQCHNESGIKHSTIQKIKNFLKNSYRP
jgi:sulfur relay (sulfurtransferase) complex TusBCD TusD component (DsrE family)